MKENHYPEAWFQTFLESITPEQTEHETSFLENVCPLSEYPRVLDLCCGQGRHALNLARGGYQVIAVDSSEYAISQARAHEVAGNVDFIVADARNYAPSANSLDAVFILWASFGYFSDEENLVLLKRLHAALRPGGRLVLDIYNRAFFEPRQGKRKSTRGEQIIEESNTVREGRLIVSLQTEDGESLGNFNWRIFTPDEIHAFAESVGLRWITSCTAFDERRPSSADSPRMQVVLEKVRN